MPHLEFLHFETLLYPKRINVEDLVYFFCTGDKTQVVKEPNDNELIDFIALVKQNYSLHCVFTEVISTYNSNFIKTTNAENKIFVELLEISSTLFPSVSSRQLISSCFSVWFIHAICTIQGQEITEEDVV
jgi:hypothetical protein